MDREPTSLKTFERCPECEYRLPSHSHNCYIKKTVGRRAFLKKIGAIGALAGIGGAGYLLGDAHAIPAPSTGSTIEPGSMEIPPVYTIYKDGSTILARNGATGLNDFSGTDSATVISSAINNLSAGRTWKETVMIKGQHTINTDITLPSYTRLAIDGQLVQGATFINGLLVIPNSAEIVEIDGGTIVGNKSFAGVGLFQFDGTVTRTYGEPFDVIKNLYIRNFNGDAFRCAGRKSLFVQCTAYQCNKSGFYIDGTDNDFFNCLASGCCFLSGHGFRIDGAFNHFYHCTANNNTINGGGNCAGFYLNGFNNVIQGGYSEGAQTLGVWITALGNENRISGLNVINNNGYGIYLIGATYCHITDCDMWDDQTPKTQTWGIYEDTGSNNNGFLHNLVWRNLTGSIRMLGPSSIAKYNNGFNPQGVAAITVTASPFTYTNLDGVEEFVTIDGGTVTTIAKNSITLYSFGGTAARCGVLIEPNESVTVTYTVAPTMNKDRK